MAMLKIAARGEEFKINQGAGNLFVCAEENGGCCCGHMEKGRAKVNRDLYGSEWEDRKLRNKLHLTFVGCLGPCPVGNNAMLLIHGRSIWFKDLNDDALIPQVFAYAEAMLNADAVLPPPSGLAAHIFERYLPVAHDDSVALTAPAVAEAENFDGLDPVCMMTVDPATAKWQADYAGKTYYFCAPSCKRTFEKDPTAYVKAVAAPAGVATPEVNKIMTKTFIVPNISCEHCVRSIKNEVGEVAGVQSVVADAASKVVTVAWDAPANWEQIEALLTEIDYAPQVLIQL